MIPAVAAKGRLAVGPRRLIKRTATGQKAEDRGADARAAAGQLAFLGMAGHQVSDLMPQNRRELGLILEVSQKAPGNEDVSPVHRKGVDGGVVQHREGVAVQIL